MTNLMSSVSQVLVCKDPGICTRFLAVILRGLRGGGGL